MQIPLFKLVGPGAIREERLADGCPQRLELEIGRTRGVMDGV